MCIFTRPVERVENTCIYARLNTFGQQYLVYSMAASLPEELAMVLPLPVARSKESEPTVEFLDLSRCPRLFDYLLHAFKTISRGGPARLGTKAVGTLPVIEVGSFEASFVPSVEDFARLDPRFQLQPDVWAQLPQYRDYGFAVFKLKPGDREVHPMALRFPTRSPDRLFFPTVHVHDGSVPEEEQFDHHLFCQTDSEPKGWTASQRPLGAHIPWQDDTSGTVDRGREGFLKVMQGRYPNQDVWIPAEPVPDPRKSRRFQSEGGLRQGLTRKEL